MILSGEAYFASVQKPKPSFSGVTKEGKKFKTKPAYEINLVLDPESLKNMKKFHPGYIKDANDKIPGKYVQFRSTVEKPEHEVERKPQVVDANKKPLTVLVGNGSKVRVGVDVVMDQDDDTEIAYYIFKILQVLELVEYNAGVSLDDFEGGDDGEDEGESGGDLDDDLSDLLD